GKADQFTQQRPGDRKRILSSILGLEVWETYRQRAAERRKEVEDEISAIDGRIQEIDAELAEEAARQQRLKELEEALAGLSGQRQAQEGVVESIRQIAARLEEQRKLVAALERGLEASSQTLQQLEGRQAQRQAEKDAYAGLLDRAEEIRASYQAWQAARGELERWEQVAAQFREQEKRRQGPLEEITAERARLSQERRAVLEEQSQLEQRLADLPELERKTQAASSALALAQQKLEQRARLEAELKESHARRAELEAETARLKNEMNELKERIDRLKETEGATCPLCGQPLSPDDRQRLIAELEAKGSEMGDRYRTNQRLLGEIRSRQEAIEAELTALAPAEQERVEHTRRLDLLATQVGLVKELRTRWEQERLPRLRQIETLLEGETFSPQARARLAEVDAELRAIGYDAAAHDLARQRVAENRSSENDFLALEKAQAALTQLARELGELDGQIQSARTVLERQTAEHNEALAALAAAQAQTPDLEAAERELYALQERENRLRMEVGAASQLVLVLDDRRKHRKSLVAERDEAARLAGQYKQLERAFGKDGVPALLIEQALPHIESKANEILDRLSAGNMSVHFITQAGFKDKRREELRETLDIQISDGAGPRDYEMFSGGEAFRANFAIRLALSEVLAQRAGARLQTLVIDEGFGSQDMLGRQRLIEAINLVRVDFAKILVITHIDELKDAFPTRIEVEKTERGSSVRVA
ncbi:MAG: SMC family ATPase, partial [Anaerolineales bacterium]|nr:SMC family ATPase [Anaerolineales bacterium]